MTTAPTYAELQAEIQRLRSSVAILTFEAVSRSEALGPASGLADLLVNTLLDVGVQYAESEHWAERRLGTLRERVQGIAPSLFPY